MVTVVRAIVVALCAAAAVFADTPAGQPATRPATQPAPTGQTIRVADDDSLAAALRRAQGGDTILVEPGSYAGFAFDRKFPDGRPLVIKSAQLHKAVFNRGPALHLGGVANVVLDGFEVTAMQMNHRGAGGLVHVQGRSRNVTLRNLRVHHAGFNDDCIKVNQAANINVIDCELHDPGMREQNNGPQETLDYYDVDGGLIQGNFFTGGTSRQYLNAKAGSRDIIIENNIMLDHYGACGDEAVVLGGHSGTVRGDYEGVNITARNNVIIGSRSGAFQVRNVKGAYIYNNLVYNCVRSPLIQAVPGQGPGLDGGSDGVYVFNNIFCNTDGRMPELMRVAGALRNFHHGNNLYYNADRPIPPTGYYDPGQETGAVLADPQLIITVEPRYILVFESLALSPDSPAIDAGAVPLPQSPGVPFDIHGMRRPQGKTFDIGPLEQ